LKKHTPLQITCAHKGDTAYIGIKGYIHKWTSASSTDVYLAIKDYKANGVTKAEVYVNTEGGSVFEAEEIVNLLIDNFGRGNVKVKIGALAASAGTVFCTDFYTTGKPNSQFMIHKPRAGSEGTEDDLENTLKLVKDVTARYRKRYAKKMNLTEKEVDALWAKGDHWMTAQEAKDKGLIDEIEEEEEQIDAESRLRLVASGAPNIPEIEQKPVIPNNTDMNLSEMALKVGLPTSASQVEIDQRIEALKKAESNLETLKTENQVKEAQKKAQSIKALLDDAEKDKKITPDQRSHYQKLAEANYESCEAILKEAPSIEAISQAINPSASKESSKGRESWTFEDYQKNPQAWEELEKKDPKKAIELIDAHYKEE